jgi:DNA-binding protein HU-beta
MTKTELQSALAEAAQTDKKTAGVFLETLGNLAYKETKKTGEFVVPGFGKLVKQKRKARTGFNPKTQQKIKIPARTVVKFRVAKAGKGRGSRDKEVVSRVAKGSPHLSSPVSWPASRDDDATWIGSNHYLQGQCIAIASSLGERVLEVVS